MSTDRIEAFSDGVFAIVITLLILEIQIPHPDPSGGDAALAQALIDIWPKFASFVVSFVVVGVYWVGHHNVFHQIKHTDRALIWINNFFLLSVVFIPFPTALVGEYIESHVAVVFYGAVLIVTGGMLSLLWWYASHNHHLVAQDIDPRVVRFANRLIWTQPLCYVGGIALSFVSIPITLAIYLLVPLLYVVPSPFLRWPSSPRAAVPDVEVQHNVEAPAPAEAPRQTEARSQSDEPQPIEAHQQVEDRQPAKEVS